MYNNDANEQNDNKTQENQPQNDATSSGSYLEKDPDEWKTGSEPTKDVRKSLTETSPDEAGKAAKENLKKEASPKAHETTENSNAEKDPDEWITGAEPMTGAQKSYLKTLSGEAGEAFDENLSKAEASKRIEELQFKTRRGLNK